MPSNKIHPWTLIILNFFNLDLLWQELFLRMYSKAHMKNKIKYHKVSLLRVIYSHSKQDLEDNLEDVSKFIHPKKK